MKIKAIAIILILSILIQIFLSPIRGGININTSTVAGYLIYFFFTGICAKKAVETIPFLIIICTVIAGILIIQLPLRIVSFNSSLSTLPEVFFHILGVFSFYIYYKSKGAVRWITLNIFFLATLLMAVNGYSLWFNKIDNGTFSGKVFSKNGLTFIGQNEDGSFIKSSDFNSKIVLMDFWFTGCKPCFTEFPNLERIYKKYKDDSIIKVSAVNLPIKGDTPEQIFQTLRKEGYTFPNFILKTEKDSNVFKIKTCPTTILIDKNGNIIFQGTLLEAEKYLDDELLNLK